MSLIRFFSAACLVLCALNSACATEEELSPVAKPSFDASTQTVQPSAQACKAAYECAALATSECVYADCVIGVCKVLPQPQGMRCGDRYDNKVCNGLGTCAYRPPTPGCLSTSVENFAPDTGCDDGNPCTVDSTDRTTGACRHGYRGLGSACGQNGLLDGQCVSGGAGEQCCPVPPAATLAICGQEGVQDACADGSVCLGGQCWIACDPMLTDACAQAPWHTCGLKASTASYICQ